MSEEIGKFETAFKSIAVLNQLILEAGAAKSLDELTFMMLNRTVGYSHYDRAVLFIIDNGSLNVKGLSGVATIQPNSEYAHSMKGMLKNFNAPESVALITAEHIQGKQAGWEQYSADHNGTSVLWLPLVTSKGLRGGIWLERWESKGWSEDEIARNAPLSVGFSHSFEHYEKPSFLTRFKQSLKRKSFMAKAAALAIALGLGATLPVPLRVVAPCEVVAEKPQIIAAPLSGVIKEIVAEPGKRVEKGELLLEYERDVHAKSLEESKQKVEVIKASLTQSLALAFDDAQMKAKLPALQSQLNEELARLEYAEYQNSNVSVVSPSAGTVVLEDKEAWVGRPVSVGEKILQVVDPAQTKVRVWIATGDKISFDHSTPIKVVLEAQPGNTFEAQLTFDNSKLEMTADGRTCFRAEAAWLESSQSGGAAVKVGQTGTAILYGEQVPLLYWIFRRPLNSLRSFTGW